MSAQTSRLFFSVLERRKSYSVKADGGYYVYSHYRAEIAEDCIHRCVYCDSDANHMGGAEAMQLDHFRPESFSEYAHLINDPNNLHYSCARCNLLKSDWWPARGSDATHDGTDGFIDPFTEDRSLYFEIASDGTITAIKPPAKYIIQLLRLNREFLRKLRELRILKTYWSRKVVEMRQKAEAGNVPEPEELVRTLSVIESLLA